MVNANNNGGNEVLMVPAAVGRVIREDEARVNVTYANGNGDLPDPVARDATDADIKAWATEAVRGGIPGIPANPTVNLTDFVCDRFPATQDVPYARIMLRPKTPFGAKSIRFWGLPSDPAGQTLVVELQSAGYEVDQLPSGSARALISVAGGHWSTFSYTGIQDTFLVAK